MPVRLTVCAGEFSPMTRLAMGSSVGGSLTAVTVTVKVRVTMLLLGWLSLTVTVIVTLPLAFGTGWKASVPLALGLMEVTVGLGITPGLLEAAGTVRGFGSLVEPEAMAVSVIVCCGPSSLTGGTLAIGSSVGG